MNIDYARRQFQLFTLRAQRAHAEIVSGAYRLPKRVKYGGEKFTDDELLKHKVDEMNRHINLASECAENIATAEGEQ